MTTLTTLAASIRELYLADARPVIDVAIPEGVDPQALTMLIDPSPPEGPELCGAAWYEVEPEGGEEATVEGKRAFRIVVARTEYDACAATPRSYDSEAVIEAAAEMRRGPCR